MDIEKVILEKLKQRGEIKVADITKATGFSRAYVSRFFKKLKDEKKILLIGKANKAKYILAAKKSLKRAREALLDFQRVFLNVNLAEDAVLNEIKRETGIFINLPKNVTGIVEYAFTEMLNNAIEHSQSEKISVSMRKDKTGINFKVIDKGIGIFKNIIKKKGLKNELEAIQDILKGKQTTMPEAHTGEGIFFTSKAADALIIRGSNKKLIFDNLLNDIFIRDAKPIIGTIVEFVIFKNSKKALSDIFREYTNEGYEFSKTGVMVKLYKTGVDYISRSQARRILGGLDKFKTIILDFKNVETIGQAFADEVFRVWQNNHSKIKLDYQNTNENVLFMIKRALS